MGSSPSGLVKVTRSGPLSRTCFDAIVAPRRRAPKAEPASDLHDDDSKAAQAYKTFLKQYPEYQLTWMLDALRRSDFARLDRSGETYVDYMGASLYPESLIRVHTGFLQRSVLGNTHSVNNS